MVGDNLRRARQAQGLSLMQVASRAKISAATLSRIETNKQSVDVTLLLLLAKILTVVPHVLLDESDQAEDQQPFATQFAGLRASSRIRIWKELAANRREQLDTRTKDSRDIGEQIEELLAQIDFLREELESVRDRLRSKQAGPALGAARLVLGEDA